MTIDEWSIVSAEVDRIEILLRIENSQPGVIGKRSNNPELRTQNPELRTETCRDRLRRSTTCQNNFSSNSYLPLVAVSVTVSGCNRGAFHFGLEQVSGEW